MGKTNFTVQEIQVRYQPIIVPTNKITDSKSAVSILQGFFDEDTINFLEECVVLYVNKNNKVLGVQKLSKGGLDCTVVDIRIVLATALKSFATGIILSHNHPSGNLNPSEIDKRITNKLNEACKIMDIVLLDHIIINTVGYFSFTDAGLINR